MTDEDIPLCVDTALCMAAEGNNKTVRALLDAGPMSTHGRTRRYGGRR